METATHTATIAAAEVTRSASLKDAPSLIERLWPAQKISAEAQKERKAGAGQTLTALGSYWKGRKPLILVRACVLAALLPVTDDPEEDLAVFEMLMRIDDESFLDRVSVSASEIAKVLADKGRLSPDELNEIFQIRRTAAEKALPCPFDGDIVAAARKGKITWADDVPVERKSGVTLAYLQCFSYSEKVAMAKRPEELDDRGSLTDWSRINRHLGTNAGSLSELVEQVGTMRYGHRPRIADTFAGGGSIPFEAARLGCDVFASDLNPIACMLTWGALNIIGASPAQRDELNQRVHDAIESVDAEIIDLGIEHDDSGNRAKAFLYCLETKCPSSGWLVPMLPSLVLSKTRKTVAELVPDTSNKRYDIRIVSDVDDETLKRSVAGTVRDGYLVHTVGLTEHRNSIKSIRGDFRQESGLSGNSLRRWTKTDVTPRHDDIFQERLYCIQWIEASSIGKARAKTFLAAPTARDEARERQVIELVSGRIADYQLEGIVPDMMIEPGEKTDEPIRTRGWTHWNHLFSPRHLLILGLLNKVSNDGGLAIALCAALNFSSKLTRWSVGAVGRPGVAPNGDFTTNAFSNQALNTLYNYSQRSFEDLKGPYSIDCKSFPIETIKQVRAHPASSISEDNDIYITDPPYADAVNYHEITEFFIAWLKKSPPANFADWIWDSRRPLAIKGDGEEFRREMVAAYRAMANHMPDNGLQIVMFTHQSGSVWADMAQIFWGAGLQVQAAWYIATETTSELKKGGYVQGTVILVLRKRRGDEAGYEDEIAQEVRAEVARQIDTLIGLNQSLKGAGRIENLFEDADLQMAGYAAALRVLTGYTRIDGRDMTAEAVRPRKKGEKGFVDRVIEFAVQVANEHMVPEGLTPRLWQQLSGTERFYLKMIDLEAADLKKLDNYQNFARAFRVPDYMVLMGDVRPNAAAIKRADDFKDRTGFDIPDFGQGVVRATLYGIYQLSKEAETDVVMDQLRGMVENYYRRRDDLVEVAEYIASQRGRDDEREGRYAGLLAQLIRNERFG